MNITASIGRPINANSTPPAANVARRGFIPPFAEFDREKNSNPEATNFCGVPPTMTGSHHYFTSPVPKSVSTRRFRDETT